MEKDEKWMSQERLKKWLKIFAVFLVFMWVCTIISKSIYVSQLPRVQVRTLDKKYIEHVVEVDGIVVAGGEKAVNVLPGLRVSGIKVQEGDHVEKGDLLFDIDMEDLAELISDKEAELTKLRYHLSDIQFNHILESQKKEIAVLWAKEDYESADKETATAVERARQALAEAETELDKHIGTSIPHTSDKDRENAWADYNQWKDRHYDLEDKIAAKQRQIEELQEQLQSLEAGVSQAGADNHETGTINTDVEDEAEAETGSSEADKETTEKREALKAAIKKAKAELDELNAQLTELDRNLVSQPDYSAEELEYDTWQQKKANLEDAVQAAKQNFEDTSFQREQTLRQKGRDIANAEVLSPADSTASIYELEIAQLQSDLADLNALKKNNGQMNAENEGFVTRVQIEAGSRTTDTAAILLTDVSAPCQFKCSITKEQGKYLNLGDSVELKINGTGTTGSAKLEAVVDYLTEGAGGYDIICRLPENTGQPGAGGSIHKSVQGELHNTVIPIEALYKESEAYYIYTLNEKTGILGKENYVEKIKVRVVDQNDVFAALEAGIVGGDTEIVTFCSDDLKQGANVRLVE